MNIKTKLSHVALTALICVGTAPKSQATRPGENDLEKGVSRVRIGSLEGNRSKGTHIYDLEGKSLCHFFTRKPSRPNTEPEMGKKSGGSAEDLADMMEAENRKIDALIQKGVAFVKYLSRVCMPPSGSKK